MTFYIDFRDDHSKVTIDAKFSHAFADVVTYSINITATTKISSETKVSRGKVSITATTRAPTTIVMYAIRPPHVVKQCSMKCRVPFKQKER